MQKDLNEHTTDFLRTHELKWSVNAFMRKKSLRKTPVDFAQEEGEKFFELGDFHPFFPLHSLLSLESNQNLAKEIERGRI